MGISEQQRIPRSADFESLKNCEMFVEALKLWNVQSGVCYFALGFDIVWPAEKGKIAFLSKIQMWWTALIIGTL